jgi:hypothetical protein
VSFPLSIKALNGKREMLEEQTQTHTKKNKHKNHKTFFASYLMMLVTNYFFSETLFDVSPFGNNSRDEEKKNVEINSKRTRNNKR